MGPRGPPPSPGPAGWPMRGPGRPTGSSSCCTAPGPPGPPAPDGGPPGMPRSGAPIPKATPATAGRPPGADAAGGKVPPSTGWSAAAAAAVEVAGGRAPAFCSSCARWPLYWSGMASRGSCPAMRACSISCATQHKTQHRPTAGQVICIETVRWLWVCFQLWVEVVRVASHLTRAVEKARLQDIVCVAALPARCHDLQTHKALVGRRPEGHTPSIP